MILLAVLIPSVASAGGYTLPVHGVRSLAMGGAELAGATGADALYGMPANLDGTEIGLDVALIHLDADYTRDGASVTNLADVVPNPTLAVIYRLNDTASFALGAYAPWSAQGRYDEAGPQRYSLIANDESVVLYIHLAVAIRLGDFRFGGGIQNVIGNIKQRVTLSAYTGLFGTPEDPDFDVLSEVVLSDPFTLSGNFSAAYDAGPVTFGVVYQLPYSMSGSATFKQRLPSSVFFDNVEIIGDQADMSIPFPMAIGAGVSVVPHERLRIEGAFRWEDWSTQQRLRITPTNIRLDGVPAIGEYQVGPAILEKRMHDTISVHLGADVRAVGELHLRGGVFWESSAFEDDAFSIALPDDTKLGIGAGISWSFYWFRLDASLAHVFQGERIVTGSELKQVNPTNPSQAVAIGNGTYQTDFWLGGLAFAWIPGSDDALGDASQTLDVSTGQR